MELELGLALPNSHFVPNIKSSILNGNMNIDNFDDNFSEKKKKNDINQNPNFSMASDDSNKLVERKTLPFLLWNGQPNEEEEGHHKRRSTFEACYQEIKEENGVVGWPPIRSWRKKLLGGGGGGGGGWNTNIDHRNNNNDNVDRIRNSRYVKVKMEGVAIGRKIDLRLYNSYQLLANTLLQMFPTDESCEESDGSFTLFYQDKQGDWMLAGDVPWETFVETVQRIQILRNWETN
ncbi:unnamed protein product [Withania somnifera]